MTRLLLGALIVLTSLTSIGQTLPFSKLHTYKTGIYDSSGTEVIAYDRVSRRIFSTNKARNTLDIFTYSDFSKPGRIASIDMDTYMGGITGVAVHFGTVAVVGTGASPQFPGKLVFLDKDGLFKAQFDVGAQPDMVTYTPGGNKVLVAGEGEPSDDYLGDPWGSVCIIDISSGFNFVSQADMKYVYFDRLDTVAYDPKVRIFGNNGLATPAEDIEPEFITINTAQTKAYVSLQENNAIAIIDINSATLDTVIGLGYKDFSKIGIDASDMAKSINISTHHNLFGMYQPDGLATYNSGGTDFILSANEGDSRNYSGYSEESRVQPMVLDFNKFPGWPFNQHDTAIGRLKVTTALGDNNNDGLYDSLYCFGGRSFSIWDENLQLVWDSGDEFEQTLKALHAAEFNSSSTDNNSKKARSDDRGPEPENIVIGEVDGKTYAFIALEQMGGIMIYDITNPMAPSFELYELNRDFSKSANDPNAGDLGPYGMVFVKANDNSRKIPLLYVANEVSGTITVYEMGQRVGLEENYPLNENTFYPNPSTGFFSTTQYGTFEVYNSKGQLVKTVTDQNTIDLSTQPSGYYVIRDTNGTSVRVIKK